MFIKNIVFAVGIVMLFSSCEIFSYEYEYDKQARIQFVYGYRNLPFGGAEPDYPVRFFDTNPAIPDRPVHLNYYKTEPGQYYLEYVLRNNKAYYMIYTIEIWKTYGTETDGSGNATTWINGELIVEKDNYKEFEIGIWNEQGGPYWSTAYYASDVIIEPIRGEIPSRSVIPKGSNVGPLLYRITQTKEGASIIIEYGVLNE